MRALLVGGPAHGWQVEIEGGYVSAVCVQVSCGAFSEEATVDNGLPMDVKTVVYYYPKKFHLFGQWFRLWCLGDPTDAELFDVVASTDVKATLDHYVAPGNTGQKVSDPDGKVTP